MVCVIINGRVGQRCDVRSSAIKFSEELSDYGYAIISGMAIGIDKFAHLGALKANGYPVAVLASSVEKPTPEVNADLSRNILNSGGTLISEYFPDTIVRPGMFASRNRIVAGLSMGTFVVEAGKKSGSLITASLANQYNREVFALPGRINNLQSYGTNELIKKGEAKLVTSVDDIIEEFGYSQGKTVLKKDDRKSIMQNLTREEEIVYTCLLTEAKFLEQISLETQISSRRLISILPMLELKDLLSRESDGRYYLSI